MEIVNFENLLTVKEGFVKSVRKDEHGGGLFQTLLQSKTEETVEVHSLGDQPNVERLMSFPMDVFPFTNSDTSVDMIFPLEEVLTDTMIPEEQRMLLQNIVSDLLSNIDETDSELRSELQQLIDETDSDHFLSWISFFDRLNQLTFSVEPNDNLKKDFQPLFEFANRVIDYGTKEQNQLESSTVRTFQTFIEKYENFNLQSVYDRWDVGEKSEGTKIVFPFPLANNRFEIDQRVKELLNNNEVQGTGKGEQIGRMPLNVQKSFSDGNMEQLGQNDESLYESLSFEQTVESSVNEDRPFTFKEGNVTDRLFTENTDQVEEVLLKGNGKSENPLIVAAKVQSNQLTGNNDSLQLVNEDNEPITYKQFEKNFSSILSRGNFVKSGNLQRLTVKLHPEHLGTLKIDLVQKQGEIVAKIISSTERTKELLEAQISSLRHAFAQQNINVSRIDMQTEGTFDSFDGQHESFNGSSSGFTKDENEDGETNEESVEPTFQETLFNMEI